MDLRIEISERWILIFEDPANKDYAILSNMNQVFYVPGMVNKHGCRIWTTNNSFMIVEAHSRSMYDVKY